MLEAFGDGGLGALSFQSAQSRPKTDSSADIKDLEALLDAATRYESGLPLNEEELQLLYQSGSSPGGARPKALCRKEDGSCWITKFPRHQDPLHVEPIEAATNLFLKSQGPCPAYSAFMFEETARSRIAMAAISS